MLWPRSIDTAGRFPARNGFRLPEAAPPSPSKSWRNSASAARSSGITRRTLKQLLEQHGIAVTVLPAVRLADYPGLVRTVASAAGKNAEGEALIAEFQTQLDATPPAGGERRRVYFELYSPYKCAGGDSYFGDLLKLAGAENIGDALPDRTRSALSISCRALPK